jgi:hypothetical protein
MASRRKDLQMPLQQAFCAHQCKPLVVFQVKGLASFWTQYQTLK